MVSSVDNHEPTCVPDNDEWPKWKDANRAAVSDLLKLISEAAHLARMDDSTEMSDFALYLEVGIKELENAKTER